MAIINIKGINKSLVFHFEPSSYDEHLDFLKSTFSNNPGLFNGSAITFRGEGLKDHSPEEITALQRLCLDYGMIFSIVESPREKVFNRSPDKDVIIYKTLRSGQKVHSKGSVIIWGDVHESAEIIAAQDIIVLGKLEGFAHAGCYGDPESLIFALNLCPRQLRIADRISRSSGDIVINNYPEIAYIEQDNICIKEYNSRTPLFK